MLVALISSLKSGALWYRNMARIIWLVYGSTTKRMGSCYQARRSVLLTVIRVHVKDVTEAGQGISMPVAQFAAVVSLLPHIETVLKEKGETIPRPEYDKAEGAEPPDTDQEAAVDSEVSENKTGKKNFEQTSDED